MKTIYTYSLYIYRASNTNVDGNKTMYSKLEKVLQMYHVKKVTAVGLEQSCQAGSILFAFTWLGFKYFVVIFDAR